MVNMGTYNESLHPRSQSGQFRTKLNDGPIGGLDECDEGNPYGNVETPAIVSVTLEAWNYRDEAIPVNSLEFDARSLFDACSVEELRNGLGGVDWVYERAVAEGLVEGHRGPFTVSLPDDFDEYLEHRVENGMTGPYPSAQDGIAAAAEASQLSPSVTEWQGLLADVNTMGGDEIRALDDETLLRLDSYLLRAAARVQAARRERGLAHPKSDDANSPRELALVDYRNISENEIGRAWMAGASQGKIGGVIRTKSDFFDHAHDEYGEDDEALIERAWATFESGHGLAKHNEDGPRGWGAQEYEAWTGAVGEELRKAR